LDDPQTEIGGNGRQLPVTSHTALASIRSGDPQRRDAELERLVGLYWKPVYSLIRRAWAATNEDAKDLTQDFFRYLLEGDVLSKYRLEKGRFRSFLKGVLRNFLSERSRDESREKRGGGVRVTSLTIRDSDLEEVLPDDQALRPDEIFDSAWRTVVLDRATRLLGERLEAQGKQLYFEVFKRYDLETVDGATSYDSIAKDLRISVDDVKNYLTRSREEFRSAVRSILCESVGSPEDLSQEWEALFGAS